MYLPTLPIEVQASPLHHFPPTLTWLLHCVLAFWTGAFRRDQEQVGEEVEEEEMEGKSEGGRGLLEATSDHLCDTQLRKDAGCTPALSDRHAHSPTPLSHTFSSGQDCEHSNTRKRPF